MKKRWILIPVLVCAALLIAVVSSSRAEGSVKAASAAPQAQVGTTASAPLSTGFTYQGRLTDGGSPANGEYDLQFALYDDATSGTLLGTVIEPDHQVTNGLFTVQLDFGQVFSGTARYLEIAVRPGDSTDVYTTLSPRQPLTPAPYALALPGLWTEQNGPDTPNIIGGYSGNSVAGGVYGATISGGGSSAAPNQVTANYGTVGGGHGNEASGRNATVGGGGDNTASGVSATVGGGWGNQARNWDATVGGGWQNTAGGNKATVSGGFGNEVGGYAATAGGGYGNEASGDYATVGGGRENGATHQYATISGGSSNAATAPYATIGGGEYISATGEAATVAGGSWITATGEYATVGGGQHNVVTATHATVGGGIYNEASGGYATVGGGRNNTASGRYATIPGGLYNTAGGGWSFATGRHAKANSDGCFVWGDSTKADVACNDDDRWVARASGGVYFFTSGDLSAGVYLPAGGETWQQVSASDRNLKENFVPVDGRQILVLLADVPITTWSYTASDSGARHIGPTAQDFYAAFGVGEDDRYLSALDVNGVALAAIQRLYAQNKDLAAEKAAQQAQIDALEARLTALEQGGVSPASQLARPWWLLSGLIIVGLVSQRRRLLGGKQ